MATVEPFATGGHGLCSPTFDKRGRLLVASSGSGEVHQVVMEGASTAMQTVFNTGGLLTAILPGCPWAPQPPSATATAAADERKRQ